MSEHIGNMGLAASGVLGSMARPAGDRTEYAVMYHGGKTLGPYDSEGACLRTLQHQLKDLHRMGVPEDYWPVMVERRVVTTVGEWKQLNG